MLARCEETEKADDAQKSTDSFQDNPSGEHSKIKDEPSRLNGRIHTERIGSIRLGTTVATNALLQRTGPRLALIVTKGFADVLHIRYQARPQIFDLDIRFPEPLAARIVEVDERVIPIHKTSTLYANAPRSPDGRFSGEK